MRVLDHEPHSWFLFEEDGKLFLDVNCTYSFFGYSWMILLNKEEMQRFQTDGRNCLKTLAQDIQDSSPILEVSTSKYKDRDVTRQYSEKTRKAVQNWREE